MTANRLAGKYLAREKIAWIVARDRLGSLFKESTPEIAS
jgi:hypothetical protein